MKYLIGILLVFLSAALAQDCQSAVNRLTAKSPPPTIEELKKRVRRYTYSAEEESCSLYSEADRNVRANSFKTEEECRGNCSRKPEGDCTSPKDSGPCSAGHKRFYFNTATSTCEKFVYGGCQGNGNNYGALYLCEDHCVPHPIDCQSAVKNVSVLEFDLMTEEEREKSVFKYTYNPTEMKCEKYFETDPNVRANSFASEENCRKRCSIPIFADCTSPKDSGPCRAAHKSFYYNTASSTCEEFEYGGCQGNGNNYRLELICDYFCTPPHCYESKAVGNCSESHKRYHYEVSESACKEFVYSGCGGNTNNFDTLELCEEKCQKYENFKEVEAE